LYRRGKTEEREILDVKREHSIQMEELQRKYEVISEENDYLSTKVAKLEQTNKEIRLAKDPNDSVKRLEGEVQYLQQQLAQF
jgi:prefoldin subunit 5